MFAGRKRDRHTTAPSQRRVETSSQHTSERHSDSRAAASGISIGVQGVLCGVLMAILFAAAFGRAVRFTRMDKSDEMSPAVKSYVDRTVYRALRDPVGRRDYALRANGGRVIPDLTWFISPDGHATESVATDLAASSVELAITDDSRIGQCWLIPGSTAQLGLRLAELMHPTHVSVDHIPTEVAFDIGQAPRAMVLWGAVDGTQNESHLLNMTESSIPALHGRSQPLVTCDFTYVPLAYFEYDIRGQSQVQTFRVVEHLMAAGIYTGVVVLEILGNWGASSTCLYRVRVHGEPRVPLST